MPRKSRLDHAFERLWLEFPATTKRRFFRDLQDQLGEDPDIVEILRKTREKPRSVAVSFDRKPNDDDFSYHWFDMMLVVLDEIMGGSGIYKPVNQLRVLRWNATCADLLTVLRHLASFNDELRFRRILIIPYPNAPVGRRLDRNVHMR